MRTALASPAAAVVALLVGVGYGDSAGAEPPPRVSMRLDYARGPGGEACPAEPTALRAEVARRMGYDPFEGSSASTPERLTVVVSRHGRGFAARIERYGADGAQTWSETFPVQGVRSERCAALLSPLATELRALLLTAAPLAAPAQQAAPTPGASTAPVPLAPPASQAGQSVERAERAVTSASAPAEPASVPRPSLLMPARVAIVAYALSAIFAGLGVAWTVDARNKDNAATALSARLHKAAGNDACAPAGTATAGGCLELFSAFQSADTASGYRNAWYAIAGTFAVVGVTSTIVALSLPGAARPAARVSIGPTALVIHGAF